VVNSDTEEKLELPNSPGSFFLMVRINQGNLIEVIPWLHMKEKEKHFF